MKNLFVVALAAAMSLFVVTNAFAVSEAQDGLVTVTVDGFLHLYVDPDGSLDHIFALDEAAILAGAPIEWDGSSNLKMVSNYHTTKLDVVASGWSGGGLDGVFGLNVRNAGDNGWVNVINGTTGMPGASQTLVTITNGTTGTPYNVAYQLTDMGVQDDPGTYTTTVTWTYHN